MNGLNFEGRRAAMEEFYDHYQGPEHLLDVLEIATVAELAELVKIIDYRSGKDDLFNPLWERIDLIKLVYAARRMIEDTNNLIFE
jgi:hypothetical protein